MALSPASQAFYPALALVLGDLVAHVNDLPVLLPHLLDRLPPPQQPASPTFTSSTYHSRILDSKPPTLTSISCPSSLLGLVPAPHDSSTSSRSYYLCHFSTVHQPLPIFTSFSARTRVRRCGRSLRTPSTNSPISIPLCANSQDAPSCQPSPCGHLSSGALPETQLLSRTSWVRFQVTPTKRVWALGAESHASL